MFQYLLKTIILIQLIFSLTSQAEIYLPGSVPDYSKLNFVPYSGSGLPADAYQTLTTSHGDVSLYAIELPIIEDGMTLSLKSLASDDKIFAATVTVLNENYMPLEFSGIENNLSICDKRLEHSLDLKKSARYVLIAPSNYAQPEEKGSFCFRWILSPVHPFPDVHYESVTLDGSDTEQLSFYISPPWFKKNRLFLLSEVESPGVHITGARNNRQPEVPSSVNMLLGLDLPIDERWFIKFKAGARVSFLNNQSHKGLIVNAGAGYRMSENWNLVSALHLDIRRKQRYFKTDYTGPNFIHYKNSAAINVAAEYHINKKWHSEAAINLTELKTKEGVGVPAHSIKLGLSYYFN